MVNTTGHRVLKCPRQWRQTTRAIMAPGRAVGERRRVMGQRREDIRPGTTTGNYNIFSAPSRGRAVIFSGEMARRLKRGWSVGTFLLNCPIGS